MQKAIMKASIRGLYAIADIQTLSEGILLSAVEQALMGGVNVLQYRDKSQIFPQKLANAHALNQLCQRYAVPFIINDDVDLAQQVQAAGVHLGQQDMGIAEARARLGDNAIIGISCHNRLSLAQQAEQAGADYVAFGRFFPSPTKPDAVHAPITLIGEAKKVLTCPIIAIGGITPAHAEAVIQAGADGIAVISGIFAQPSIAHAANKYSRLF